MSNVHCPPRARLSVALALIAGLLGAGAGCSQGAATHAREARSKSAARASMGDGVEEKAADGVVSWSATLEEDVSVLEEFEQRAQAHGCATQHEGNGVLARCDGTPIMVVQKGRKVAVGCQRVTLEDCHALFEEIVSERDDEDGGGTTPAKKPPPGTTRI